MRGHIDPLDPQHLRPRFRSFFLRPTSGWPHPAISILAAVRDRLSRRVEHFSSTKIHYPSCTTRTHPNGVVSCYHAGLAAVLLHPAQAKVFPLDFEPILRPDGGAEERL